MTIYNEELRKKALKLLKKELEAFQANRVRVLGECVNIFGVQPYAWLTFGESKNPIVLWDTRHNSKIKGKGMAFYGLGDISMALWLAKTWLEDSRGGFVAWLHHYGNTYRNLEKE